MRMVTSRAAWLFLILSACPFAQVFTEPAEGSTERLGAVYDTVTTLSIQGADTTKSISIQPRDEGAKRELKRIANSTATMATVMVLNTLATVAAVLVLVLN
jgi:hypothetical protein